MDNKDTYEKIHELKMNDGSEIDVLKCSESHRLFLKRIIKGSESLFMVELDDFISFKYGRKNLLDILKIYCNYKDLLDSLEGTDLRVVTEPLNVGDEVFILSFNTPMKVINKGYRFELKTSEKMYVDTVDSPVVTLKNHDFALLDFMIGSFTTNHIHNEESIIENICKEEDLELNKHLAKVFLIEYIRNEKDKLNQSINHLTVISKSIN